MSRLIRSHDWTASPVGPMERWPWGLRVTLNFVLPARAQIVVFWGPEFATFYNDAYASSLGSKHPRVLGRPAREGWAEMWDDVAPMLAQVMDRGEPLSARDRHFRIDRRGFLEDVWFDVAYSPIHGEGNRIDGVMCVVNETTERVLGVRAVQESEARVRTAREQIELALNTGAVLGTWVWEVPSDRFHADERFARTFGLDARPLAAGVPLESVKQSIHADDIGRVNSLVAEALRAGGAYRAEYRVPRETGGGWRWVEAHGRVEVDAGGQPLRFPGLLIDIDRRCQAETTLREAQDVLRLLNANLEKRVAEQIEELRHTQSRLHESQKMEALGQLTGGIAHDFNNMLQGITMAIEVMRRRAAAGHLEDVDRYAGRALETTRRAAGLVQRLLAFARRQTLDPRPVAVAAMVLSLQDLLRRTLGENVRLRVDMPADPWQALCDENQLESAVLNLCINSRDAMPQGGDIIVRVDNAVLGEVEAAAYGADAPGDFVRIEVRDTGHGMDARALAHAFEPFFTTKPSGQGTGLGLPMIYGFARQSGGGVRLESEVGRGTTATLYLPRHAGGVAAAAPAAARAPLAVGEGREVLVVEDDPAVRHGLVDSLKDLGYRTLEAADADAALRLLGASRHVALMVVDVGLPGMNGRQLAEHVRVQRPQLPILMITGYAPATQERGDAPGDGIAIIAKPFKIDELARALLQLSR